MYSKATGSDNTAPELIQNERRTLKRKLYKLIWKVWDNEQYPAQWNEGIICPNYKRETD